MRQDSTPAPDIQPLLVQLGDSLDQDLTLRSLAKDLGYSPSQLHRRFSAAVGETPKKHVERLRLERAAYVLAVTQDRVVDIGFAVGFNDHETFTRAFRRWFGHTPTAFRRLAHASQTARMRRMEGFRGEGCELSDARFQQVRATPLLAVRRMGAYGSFEAGERQALWDELTDWAEANGHAYRPVRMGLFPTDPGITPGHLQWADICIPLGAPATGTERLRGIELEGGLYGVIEHEGPYETVDQAYRTLADAIRRSDYVFRDGPPVQVFRETAIGGDPAANRSEVWFPVRKP